MKARDLHPPKQRLFLVGEGSLLEIKDAGEITKALNEAIMMLQKYDAGWKGRSEPSPPRYPQEKRHATQRNQEKAERAM